MKKIIQLIIVIGFTIFTQAQDKQIKTLKNTLRMGIARAPIFIVDGKIKYKVNNDLSKDIISIQILSKDDFIKLSDNKLNTVVIITTKKALVKKKKKSQQLYIIDGKKASFKKYTKLLSLNIIKSSHKVKSQKMIELYGKKAKNGVIFITTN